MRSEIASPRVVVALASAASARTVPQTARDDHNVRKSGCAGAGILRLYGRAKIHKSGPVYEEIWNRLIEAEKKGDPEKRGYAVLLTIERAEDLSGQPLT